MEKCIPIAQFIILQIKLQKLFALLYQLKKNETNYFFIAFESDKKGVIKSTNRLYVNTYRNFIGNMNTALFCYECDSKIIFV